MWSAPESALTIFLDLSHTVDGPPAEPVEAMIALGFAARDQGVSARLPIGEDRLAFASAREVPA
jgi:hypothetical protein